MYNQQLKLCILFYIQRMFCYNIYVIANKWEAVDHIRLNRLSKRMVQKMLKRLQSIEQEDDKHKDIMKNYLKNILIFWRRSKQIKWNLLTKKKKTLKKDKRKFIESCKPKSLILFKSFRQETKNHSNKSLVTTKPKKIFKHIEQKLKGSFQNKQPNWIRM